MKLATAIALLASLEAAAAQELRFDAVVDEHGKVQLVPKKTEGAEEPAPAKDTASHPQVYVLTDARGQVKAVFDDAHSALQESLLPGDTLAVVPMNTDTAAGPTDPTAAASVESYSYDYMREIAQQAATQLMQGAHETACSFEVKPESISPSVEISFSLLAGGSFSVSATWLTKDLCPSSAAPASE